MLESQPMIFFMFDLNKRNTIVGNRGESRGESHRFGGGGYAGLQRHPDYPPVHVLFRLDTHDPLVPCTSERFRWLPLLCAIQYGAGDVVYLVDSDDQITIIHQNPTEPWENYPYPDYPDVLPEEPVFLEERGYMPSDPFDAWYFAGVFGYDDLSESEMNALKEFVTDNGFHDEELTGETLDEYLEDNELPYVQGRPPDLCRNPACRHHNQSSLQPFAIFSEADERLAALWGEFTGSLQITYMICKSCQAIHTSNQCT